MTKIYFNKNITCFFLLLMMVSLLSPGCGSWQKRTMTSYQATGATLNKAKPILKTLIANGTLSAKEGVDAKQAYDDAVDIYKIMGTTAIIAIDVDDQSAKMGMDAARKLYDEAVLAGDHERAAELQAEINALMTYSGMQIQLMKLVNQLANFTERRYH